MISISPEKVGISADRLNRIDELMTSYIENGNMAGAISVVVRRNNVVHFNCHGHMNFEKGQVMREDAIFRLYSMTKPITSVAVMILYERGYFQLDTPVSKFIPEFKDLMVFESGTATGFKTTKPLREMTIADLLKHTSGLTYDYFNQTPVDEMYKNQGLKIFASDMTLPEIVKGLAQVPLLFSPGTKWNYSISTDVLGYIIEIVSGLSLDVFLKREILDPLGMVDTDFFVPLEKVDRFTAVYMHKSGMPVEITQNFPEKDLYPINDPKAGIFTKQPPILSGGGGLVSTASDYLNFLTMMLNKGRVGNDNLLSPKSTALMTQNHLPSDLNEFCLNRIGRITSAGIGFGLGFNVMLDPAKANSIGTPGEFNWLGAAHTSFFVDPKEELIGLLMTQMFPMEKFNIRLQFKTAVYQAIIDS